MSLSESVSMGNIPIFTARNEVGQGYIFTGVCDSVHRGGSASVHAGIPHPPSKAGPPTGKADPLSKETPLWQGRPPGKEIPLCSACWEIQSTSAQYASYWNAILVGIANTNVIAKSSVTMNPKD